MYQTSEHSGSNWNLEVLAFEGRGKPEYPEKNLSEQRGERRTNNKLKPHMTPSSEIEPGPHQWEASALTTAPSLLPSSMSQISIKGNSSIFTLEEEYALYTGHFKQSARLRMGFFSLYSERICLIHIVCVLA